MSAHILETDFFKISFMEIKIKMSETNFIKIYTSKVNFKEIKFIKINYSYVNFSNEKKIKEIKVKISTRCPSTLISPTALISTTAGERPLRFAI